MMTERRARRGGGGAILIGLVLVVVGGYHFLTNTLGIAMPDVDSEAVWPVVILVLGAVILYRAWRESEQRPVA